MKKIAFGAFLIFLMGCGPQKPPEVGIYLFDVGLIQVNDVSSLNGGDQIEGPHYFTNTAYLIRHPKGDLIWDTGFHDSTVYKPLGVPGVAFYSTMSASFESQLRAMDVNPEEVDYLAVSHLHPDHTGNMGLFKNATIVLQKEEYEALLGPEGTGPEHLKDNDHIQLQADRDLFGDGTVRFIRTPGHTNGHQVLLVQLPETGPVILSGDLYLFRSDIKSQGIPFFNVNQSATRKSWARIKQLRDSTGAQLWVQHDSLQMKSLPFAPQAVR